jgi:hypothetical protein
LINHLWYNGVSNEVSICEGIGHHRKTLAGFTKGRSMSIRCVIFPRRDATPRQRRELGAALHRWYARESREHGMALYTNQQGINALLAGSWPPAEPRKGKAKSKRRPPVLLDVRGGKHYNRQATIESLRKDIPASLVDDVLIDGRSWGRAEEHLVHAIRLPNGNLLIPVEAEDPGAEDGLAEIGPDHAQYGTWFMFAQDRKDPRPRKKKKPAPKRNGRLGRAQ